MEETERKSHVTRCSLFFLTSFFLSSNGDLASYVRCTPPPHTHLQARLSPANQGALVAWASVFSSCNKIHTVCSRLHLTSEGQDINRAGRRGWELLGRGPETAITLCATAVITHGDLLPW